MAIDRKKRGSRLHDQIKKGSPGFLAKFSGRWNMPYLLSKKAPQGHHQKYTIFVKAI